MAPCRKLLINELSSGSPTIKYRQPNNVRAGGAEERGLLMRCFTNVSDTQVDMFHLWKDKSYQSKTRKEFSTKFWEDIKEMGGVVSLTEGECEVEMSPFINSSLIKMK